MYGVSIKFTGVYSKRLIHLESSSSGARWILDKKYSDFTLLYKTLKKKYKTIFQNNSNELDLITPSTSIFSGKSSNANILKKRVEILDTWIKQVVRFPLLVEDESFTAILLKPTDIKSQETIDEYNARVVLKKKKQQEDVLNEQKLNDEKLKKIQEQEKQEQEKIQERSSPMYSNMSLHVETRRIECEGSEREGKVVYDIILLIETKRERELMNVASNTPSCRWIVSKSYSQFAQFVTSIQKEIGSKRTASIKQALPAKGSLFTKSTSKEFLDARQEALVSLLQILVNDNEGMESQATLSFLSSDYSLQESQNDYKTRMVVQLQKETKQQEAYALQKLNEEKAAKSAADDLLHKKEQAEEAEKQKQESKKLKIAEAAEKQQQEKDAIKEAKVLVAKKKQQEKDAIKEAKMLAAEKKQKEKQEEKERKKINERLKAEEKVKKQELKKQEAKEIKTRKKIEAETRKRMEKETREEREKIKRESAELKKLKFEEKLRNEAEIKIRAEMASEKETLQKEKRKIQKEKEEVQASSRAGQRRQQQQQQHTTAPASIARSPILRDFSVESNSAPSMQQQQQRQQQQQQRQQQLQSGSSVMSSLSTQSMQSSGSVAEVEHAEEMKGAVVTHTNDVKALTGGWGSQSMFDDFD